MLVNPIVYMSEGLRAALTPTLPHMHPVLILGMLVVFLCLLTWLGVEGFCAALSASRKSQSLRGVSFLLQIHCDQLAVEAAVLDKDLVGPLAGDDDSGEVDARDIALERRRIADRAAVVRFVQLHAERSMKLEVRVIAGEREDELIRQRDVRPPAWRA